MSKPTILTDEQRIAYVLNGGSSCPLCGDETIDGTSVQIDNGTAWQNVSCNECNAEWQDIYSLTDVIGQ